MIARAPDEVRKLVSAGRWKRKHLESMRRQFGDEALFDALFSAFTQSPPLSLSEQQAPGTYLLELKPRGSQGLQALILEIASGLELEC